MKKHLGKNSFKNFSILSVSVLLLIGGFAQAQSAKSSSSKNSGAVPAPAPSPESSDKLDVSDLEKKYWTAKDTDFSVVQNRAYTKAGRWAFSFMYGPMLNDSYSDGYTMAVSGHYFFSERMGLELTWNKTSAKDNKSVATLMSNQGAKPDFNRPYAFYGVGFNYVPFYAKMSVLNSKIMYFDMAITPGLGLAQYEQQMDIGGSVQSSPAAFLNVTQHFFLNNTWAIRAEFQNRWYNQDVNAYRLTSLNSANGRSLRTDFAHDTMLLFGIDFFF